MMQDNNALAQELEALAAKATPGQWGIWFEQIGGMADKAIQELVEQVHATDPIGQSLVMIDADGKCPAITGCGPTSGDNAALITALRNNLPTILSALRQPAPASGEVGERPASVMMKDVAKKLREYADGSAPNSWRAGIERQAADMLERLAGSRKPSGLPPVPADAKMDFVFHDDQPTQQPGDQVGLDDTALAPFAHDAAISWCGEKDRETFQSDVDYFLNNWKALPGLRAYVARAALAAMPSGDVGQWLDIESAPYNTPVKVKLGQGMEIVARLIPNASMTTEEQSCDQWQAEYEGEHPECWSGGACWESNENEALSMQPEGWMPLPTPPAQGEG